MANINLEGNYKKCTKRITNHNYYNITKITNLDLLIIKNKEVFFFIQKNVIIIKKEFLYVAE